MKHLFLFTIGPVQSFISQARKTQDLAAGSKMLHDLVWEAIQFLAGENDNTRQYIQAKDLIFPNLTDLRHPPQTNLPNRFLTIIDNVENIQEVGNQLQKHIQEHYHKNGKERINGNLNAGEALGQTIDTQLKNALDIYWAAVPLNEASTYKTQHESLEKLLAGIKNVRTFNQMPEKGRKCHLDGVNNVVVYRSKNEEEAQNDRKPWWIQEGKTDPVPVKLSFGNGKNNEFRHKAIQPGEGLSAVSFYKRLYKSSDDWKRKWDFETYKKKYFPSTAEIASWHIIEKLQDECARELKCLFDTDEQFLYEDNLTEEQLKPFSEDKKIKDSQSIVAHAIEQHELKLTPYYAIIRFDADKMGEMLKGAFLTDQSQTKEYQKLLSKKLMAFAQFAKDCVNDNYGRSLYAGGDDFVGFINLERLFPVLHCLRVQFREMVNDPLKNEYHLKDEFTFSAGIVIAHYKAPLHFVLEEAHKAEFIAKNDQKGDRNAFCLTTLKQGGELNYTYGKWFPFEDEYFLPDDLEWLINKFNEGQLSQTFIRHLASEFKPLMNQDGEIPAFSGSSTKAMIKEEFARLIRQSCIKEELKHEAGDKASGLFEAFDKGNGSFPFFNFIQALYTTEFLQSELSTLKHEEPVQA